MLEVVQRILIIQLKRLGDFILTIPVVPALRAAFPSAELVMVVPSAVAELARCVSSLDRVISFHPGRPNLETWTTALAGEWDACLDFSCSDRSALLTKISRAKRRVGYAKHARRLRKFAYNALSEASVRDCHTVDFHLALLGELGLQPSGNLRSAPLRLPADARSHAKSLLDRAGVAGRYAIVHPGTAREEKFWVDERWAEVCARLRDHHHLSVVLTGTGEGIELPHLESLRKHLRVPVADFTGELNLVEFAAVVAGCEVIVGVDSMAMHLASLFSKPQLALFGPTNPYHWRPRHDRARVLMPSSDEPLAQFTPKTKRQEMRGIAASSVSRALDALIG